MDSESTEVIVLGKKIGNCSGWDMINPLVIHFYDFESALSTLESYPGFTINFETGIIQGVSPNGSEVIWEGSLMEHLK